MSPSATPATQRWWMSPSAAASPATKTGPSAPPEPAQCHKMQRPPRQNEGGCDNVPRLPRETKVDVTKMPHLPRKVPRCHRRPKPAQVCHQSQPSAISAISATPATQDEGGCDQGPRLPRETKVDVTKCHACHAKRKWM